MDERLEDFAGLLRQNGLRISPAEVADAAQAALLVGMEDRAAFRGALRATLVKRGQDAPVFDRLFELYFTGAKDLVEGLQESLLDALESEKLDELQLEEIARMLARMSPLTQALAAGRADQLARILRQAMLGIDFRGLQSPLQRGFYARRLLQAAGGSLAEKELQQLLDLLQQRGLDPARLDLASHKVSRTLQALEEAARRVADREQKARDPEARGDKSLLHRSLASLTADEVQRMREVTHLFKNMDVSTAVDLATAGRVINLSANSNYGHALKLFHNTWLGSITRRTTVIVIGDGRTNYNPPNAWALADLKRRCRRLVWLCPEEKHSWGFGDSEMPLYARHCHRVESVRSLDDLARVAAELMP